MLIRDRQRMEDEGAACGAAYLDEIAAKNKHGDHETIARLASLTPIEYDRKRKEEAKKLNIRQDTLDKEVAKLRPGNENDVSGQSVLFPEVEPWPDPVDGAELLNDLANSARSFMILPDHAEVVLALWVMFTYLIDAVDIAPILAITSPEKRCGKTTLLSWLSRLVARALPVSNITAAALFRSVEKWNPTLMIDEADTFLKNSDELRGIINSGHTRTSAFVIRTTGDDHEPRCFATWCAKVIALIGTLRDTLIDRAIHIEMSRKLPTERIESMRDISDHFEILGKKIARWADDHIKDIRAARPRIPENLNDRAADSWPPLLGIADCAGGDWPTKARQAATALTNNADDASLSVELLSHIKMVFDRIDDNVLTGDLITALCEDEEAPWSTWNKGKPITARQLARKLKSFGITTNQTVRTATARGKGYKADQFSDAFTRYLSVTRGQVNTGEGFRDIGIGDTPETVTDEKTLERSAGAGCHRVTDGNTPPEGETL